MYEHGVLVSVLVFWSLWHCVARCRVVGELGEGTEAGGRRGSHLNYRSPWDKGRLGWTWGPGDQDGILSQRL